MPLRQMDVHSRSDDGSGDAACSAKSGLGGNEDVGDVLVFAQQRQVEENLDGLGVCNIENRKGDDRACQIHAIEAVAAAAASRQDRGASLPAVMTMNSAIPRLRVLVASLALQTE